MAAPTIDQLPEAGQPSDPKKLFDQKMYAFVNAMNPFVDQANALSDWLNENINLNIPVEFTTTSLDLDGAQTGSYIRATNSSAKIINVRLESEEAMPDGANYFIRNLGAGDLTLSPSVGVAINGNAVVENGASIILQRVGADLWDFVPLGGDFTADLSALETAIEERVIGPSSSDDDQIALFDGLTGKILKAGQTITQLFNSWIVTLYNIFPRTIPTVADIAAVTPVGAGQLFNLKEYNEGTLEGGGQLVAVAGTPTTDNKATFACSGSFHLRRINYGFLDSRMGGVSDNAVPPEGLIGTESVRSSYVGNSGGASDIRNFLIQSQLNGASGALLVATQSYQSEVRHTSGTVTFAYGVQGYSRLGRLGSTTGNVTTFRGVEWHTANEGTGTIENAYNFFSQEIDLVDGTGNINAMKGFYCGDQGHATRIAIETIGFDCANFTSGAPITVAFRSQMGTGANRFSFLATGGAPNAFAGALKVGSATAPTDTLEAVGFAKLSQDGTKTTTGDYHEINSGRSDYVLHVKNNASTAPQGLRIRFTGASPNNTTQDFLRCEDSTSGKMVVYSNGNIVNANNSYGGISDDRLKTDICPAQSVLEKFRARQFKTYKLKGSNETVLGVIAQEELNVSPNLVTLGGDGFYSYNYSGLAVEAAQAVGELLKIVDELQAKIKKLES